MSAAGEDIVQHLSSNSNPSASKLAKLEARIVGYAVSVPPPSPPPHPAVSAASAPTFMEQEELLESSSSSVMAMRGGSSDGGGSDRAGMDSGKYVRYTPDQVEMLERVYADCPKPTSSRRQQLLRECPILANIEARQIKVWFQNRRCRDKLRKESSRLESVNRKVSAMNKLLMEENERLQKQVSQLVHENAQVRQQLQNTSMANDTSCESNLTTPQNPIRDASNPSGLLSIAEETLTEFLSKATGTAIEWVQMPGMKPGPDSVGIVAISHGCRGVAARACGLVNLEPTKVVEILKDRPSWFRDCRSLEVFTVLPGANGGTIELVYTQLYAPTTLVPARDFWTLRYTTIVEDGSLVVCERSLSGSGGGPSAASAQQFVRAEMLPSGYLVRPCDGGGSIVHIVDHLEFEAWNIPEVLRPLYESSRTNCSRNKPFKFDVPSPHDMVSTGLKSSRHLQKGCHADALWTTIWT
ncbi:hypothetical protein ZWY2020_038947 [Hordeum vulgare]|nr:hypothetical protein ZWY2020_038947 [Hordeum vulgare]